MLKFGLYSDGEGQDSPVDSLASDSGRTSVGQLNNIVNNTMTECLQLDMIPPSKTVHGVQDTCDVSLVVPCESGRNP